MCFEKKRMIKIKVRVVWIERSSWRMPSCCPVSWSGFLGREGPEIHYFNFFTQKMKQNHLQIQKSHHHRDSTTPPTDSKLSECFSWRNLHRYRYKSLRTRFLVVLFFKKHFFSYWLKLSKKPTLPPISHFLLPHLSIFSGWLLRFLLISPFVQWFLAFSARFFLAVLSASRTGKYRLLHKILLKLVSVLYLFWF